jgi:hypothetical protein
LLDPPLHARQRRRRMTRVPLKRPSDHPGRAREEPADHDAPDRLGPNLRATFMESAELVI